MKNKFRINLNKHVIANHPKTGAVSIHPKPAPRGQLPSGSQLAHSNSCLR